MATNFELPENIGDLSTEELAELREQALAAFDEIYGDESRRTNADLDQMRSIKASIDSLDAAATARSEAETEIDAMAQSLRAEDSDDEDPEEEAPVDSDDAPTDEAPVEDAEPDAPADEAPAEDATDAADEAPDEAVDPTDSTDSTADDEDEDADEPLAEVVDIAPSPDPDPELESDQEPIAVAASSTPPAATEPSVADINANRPSSNPITQSVQNRGPATMVAAANLPNHAPGQALDMSGVTEALFSRIQNFPKGPSRGAGEIRSNVAQIVRPFADHELVRDESDFDRVADTVTDERNLPNGSLTAAGGWCAPSETLYDVCSLETTSGMLSVPTMNIPRGGIRHTVGPDFRSIYDGTGFQFTEADDIAGDYQPEDGGETEKPCAVVPCPAFEEQRLDVVGLCVTGGILQDVAYPEMTQRFVEGSLIAHGHIVNNLVIEEIATNSDAVAPTAFGGSSTSILSALELVGTDMRYRHRMSETASLEAVFPFWVLGAMRADLSNRLGVDMLSISDAQLVSWMRDRNVNPQFVYDWQDDMADGASGFGAAAAQVDWPDTVDFLLYPAGTWVKGEQDIISLDAIYDSVNIRHNNYNQLFVEDGWLVAKRCHDSRVVTVDGWNCFGDTAAGTACA